jgi:hypothetical protein
VNEEKKEEDEEGLFRANAVNVVDSERTTWKQEGLFKANTVHEVDAERDRRRRK